MPFKFLTYVLPFWVLWLAILLAWGEEAPKASQPPPQAVSRCQDAKYAALCERAQQMMQAARTSHE